MSIIVFVGTFVIKLPNQNVNGSLKYQIDWCNLFCQRIRNIWTFESLRVWGSNLRYLELRRFPKQDYNKFITLMSLRSEYSETVRLEVLFPTHANQPYVPPLLPLHLTSTALDVTTPRYDATFALGCTVYKRLGRFYDCATPFHCAVK